MKDRLTKEESARLIELGVPKEMATGYITELYHGETEYIDVFSLYDLLKILPKMVGDSAIYIHTLADGNWSAMYYGFYYSCKIEKELIDALYELLCLVIENNYLKTEQL